MGNKASKFTGQRFFITDCYLIIIHSELTSSSNTWNNANINKDSAKIKDVGRA